MLLFILCHAKPNFSTFQIMEKFLISAQGPIKPNKLFLNLPAAKQYEVHAIINGEAKLDEEVLLDMAVNRKKSEIFHIFP